VAIFPLQALVNARAIAAIRILRIARPPSRVRKPGTLRDVLSAD
jgi:hypothetical protein